MRTAQPPSFPFYASDYLSSSKVQLMTLEEEGAYIRLLSYNWQDGYIPSDITELSRLCKCGPKKMEVLWKRIKPCFVENGDPARLVSPRLEEVRAEMTAYRNAQKMRADMRWHKRGKGSAYTEEMQVRSLPPGNALQSPKEKPPIVPQEGDVYSPDFEIVWEVYPNHAGKGAAWKAWTKLKPSRQLQDIMLGAIAAGRNSREWTKDSGQYVPHLSTWLNQRRWDDELTPNSKSTRMPL